MAILISGRGSNMKALIDAAEDLNFPAQITLVLSNKKEALGLEYAVSRGIKTAIIKHDDFKNSIDPRLEFEKAMNKEILASGAEIICLAGFMRLLSPWFVSFWQNRIINIHPSLLPSFKGANAVQDAIDAGVKISGCTTHYVSNEMDSGKIIMQKCVIISEKDNKESLARRILQAEHEIYPQTLLKICQNFSKENFKKPL